jgi:hypothetical protein
VGYIRWRSEQCRTMYSGSIPQPLVLVERVVYASAASFLREIHYEGIRGLILQFFLQQGKLIDDLMPVYIYLVEWTTPSSIRRLHTKGLKSSGACRRAISHVYLGKLSDGDSPASALELVGITGDTCRSVVLHVRSAPTAARCVSPAFHPSLTPHHQDRGDDIDSKRIAVKRQLRGSAETSQEQHGSLVAWTSNRFRIG